MGRMIQRERRRPRRLDRRRLRLRRQRTDDRHVARQIERKTDGAIQFREKTFRRPAMFQEKIFQPRLFPALAKNFACAKDFRNPARRIDHLILPYKSIQLQCDVRFGR